MFESINEVAVLVSTILALAIGSIWYSPLLFGKPWMRAVGLTEEDLETSKSKMPKMFVAAAIANAIALFAIAHLVSILQTIEAISIRSMALLLIILFGALTVGVVIWERKPFSYWLINLGYTAVIILGGIAVIGYWPW